MVSLFQNIVVYVVLLLGGLAPVSSATLPRSPK